MAGSLARDGVVHFPWPGSLFVGAFSEINMF